MEKIISITEDKLDSRGLMIFPLGGQSELGQMLWVLCYLGEILLVDAGAAYPAQDLPGVDLLLPNTSFLEANKDKIQALLLTNGHEEHCGALPYILRHLSVPRVMAPRFVSAFFTQHNNSHSKIEIANNFPIETVDARQTYKLGHFQIEWVRVNDAIADACALHISTPEGNVLYTSSFKFDQTPVDKRVPDVRRLAQLGDDGILLLISSSAGVESYGYTPSEKSVEAVLESHINNASGRVILVMSGTNTHRLQILFDIAKRTHRRALLIGDILIKTAVAALVTGNLQYDPKVEVHPCDLNTLSDKELLVIATGTEGDPMKILSELARGTNEELSTKEGDTVIVSAAILPGRLRQMANILDQFLSQGVSVVQGEQAKVHVPKHASREELKLMLSVTNPTFFIPAFGEGRHIMHHAQLAIDWGMAPDAVFPLKNGEMLSIDHGIATVIGAVESQAVLVNRDQGERVTTFTVNERKALSIEGIITISVVIDEQGKLLSGPRIDAGAAGFLNSREWEETKEQMKENILVALDAFLQKQNRSSNLDISQLRSSLREAALKTVRSRLQTKPIIQVFIHHLATKLPQS